MTRKGSLGRSPQAFGSEARGPLFSAVGACVVLVGMLSLSSIAPAAELKTYVFSDVRHIAEVDDYIGTEIVIRVAPRSTRVIGQWDLYQGYDPITMQLEGTLVGPRLEMKGIDSDGLTILTATFSEKSLCGTLKWYVGSNRQTRNIRLLRVQDRLQDLRRRNGNPGIR
jgi:hypothetical protein